jgi:NADH-quinone oxidoreductase subunit K
MQIGLYHFLFVAAGLFAAGMLTMLVKRNALGILMGVELVLNAANVNLVAFGRYGLHPIGSGGAAGGQVLALFVIVIAAGEAAVAMAIFLNFYNNFSSIDVEQGRNLRG